MSFETIRFGVGGTIAAMCALALTVSGAGTPTCDADNGGIKLPQGFCALVAADSVGPARHLAVAANGDIYVALETRGGRGQAPVGGGVVALRDADGDNKFEVKEAFGAGSTTGVALRNGYIYLAHPTTIERFKMTAGQLKPTGQPETVVTGLPEERQHEDKALRSTAAGRCTSMSARRATPASSPIDGLA